MASPDRPPHRSLARSLLGASALALPLAAGPAQAESLFTPTSDGFSGYVSVEGPDSAPIYPGVEATITGEDLIPGQRITLLRGPHILNPETPLIVDEAGVFSFALTVDASAATGLHPLVVIGENPAAATVVDLKVSPKLPVFGEEKLTIASGPATKSPYQVGYSAASGAVFVTGAVGRPPVKEAELVKLDAETLEKLAAITPDAAPVDSDGEDGGLFAVYGLGVDDANGHVWVSNTRQDTVAVYRQDDLSLVKRFPLESVNHPRDVLIDETRGRAYVSAIFGEEISVFDTKTLEQLEPIKLKSGEWGKKFTSMAMDLNVEAGKLVTVSLETAEIAVVDLDSGAVRVIPTKGAKGASGAAYDPKEGLIFVTSQETDNLLIVDEKTGEVLHDVETGANALSVAFEPVSRLAFVLHRDAGTLVVVTPEGEIVANVDMGGVPNQLRPDGKGDVYAVNKAYQPAHKTGDRVWRIRAVE